MAILDGIFAANDLEILLFSDPKRWRVTIWMKRDSASSIRSRKVRVMHDKDRSRVLRRAFEFSTEYKTT